jgi:Ca2+-binding RTX toxin-like protein
LIRATISGCVTLLVSVLVGLGPVAVSPAHADDLPPLMLGPGDADVNGIGHEAVIRMSKYGLVYIAGKHDSHLTITYVADKHLIRYRDTRTLRVKSKPDRCRRERVAKGISVVCLVPPRFRDKMFVQVWPRLGNDFVDGRDLPRQFRLWALADAGRDVMYGGAGADFFNGAKDGDRAYGGPGSDWLRGGPAADVLVGGAGRDRIAHG